MAVNRTIYTQGAVGILPATLPTWFNSGTWATTGTLFLTGVQSANYSVNSPKLDVSSFGLFGTINKVQVEPQTAQLEVTLAVNSGNSTADPHWLAGLVYDAQQPQPSGVTVTASGVGEVRGAILTAVRLEATIGALATLSLTFDGVSGAHLAANSPPVVPNSITVPVMTPDQVQVLGWVIAAGSGCPRTVRGSWEMPVERILCLGTPVNSPTIFSRPPGTMSFTAEGVDFIMLNDDNYLTGITLGPYALYQAPGSIKEVTRTTNMAVGEAVSTYNITSEGIALGATIGG